MKKRRLSKALCFFVSFLLTMNLGVALWSLKSESAYPAKDISKRTEPVAYITRGSTTSYFTTIEAALKDGEENNASSDTIYVIPKTVTTIKKDCTVSIEDTLCLPFEGTTYNGRQSGSFEKAKGTAGEWRDDIGTADFVDGNQASVEKYLQSNITINPNVTLKVNGSLQIGGVLGTETQQLQGQTSGKYCQITMDSSSKIDNYGSIDCMGYIKEKSKNNKSQIINNGNAKMSLPYVVYDYKGGSFTASVYANDTYKEFPISQFDFPNSQIEMTFKYGSSLVGYADLYTNTVVQTVSKKIGFITLKAKITLAARHNTDNLAIIGNSDSLFEYASSDSSIVMKYTPTGSNEYTSYSMEDGNRIGSGGLTSISISNGIIFNATSLKIDAAGDVSVDPTAYTWAVELVMDSLNQTVKTSEVYFPFSWNYTFNVKSGVFNVNNRIKFLGGAKITIDKGAELANNSSIMLYDSSSGGVLYKDTAASSTIHPYSKGDAVLVNDGTLRLKKGSSFGGKIQSKTNNSSIVAENGANLTNTSREGKGSW